LRDSSIVTFRVASLSPPETVPGVGRCAHRGQRGLASLRELGGACLVVVRQASVADLSFGIGKDGAAIAAC
jgi:hypothetical protein